MEIKPKLISLQLHIHKPLRIFYNGPHVRELFLASIESERDDSVSAYIM